MFMSNGKAVKCLDEIPWNCSHVKETELHPFSFLLPPEASVVLVLLKPHTLWCNHGENHNDCASTVIWFLVHYITARARCQWIPWISTKNKQKKKVTRLRWRCFPCPEEGWMRLSIHAWLRLWSSYCWWNCAVKTELLLYMITSLCVKWLITTTLQLKIDNMSHKSSCYTYVKSFASFIARRAVNLIIGILQGNAILWHI